MEACALRKIRSEIVGTVIGRVEQSVPLRNAMAFAAVTGAYEPCYFDDRIGPSPLVAPCFVVALEWAILDGPGWRGALGADQRMMQECVHVVQDSRFPQPLRVGDTVETTGRVVAARQTRAGVLVHVMLQTRRMPAMELCAESLFSAIFLRAELDGQPPEPLVTLPALRSERDVVPGGTEIVLEVDRALPFTYTECSGIWNPIHTERGAAQAAGFADVLLHGTCTWAMSANAVVTRLLGGDPTRLRRFAGAFHAPVIPPQRLSLALAPEATISAPSGSAAPSPRQIALCVRTAANQLALHSVIAEIEPTSQ